MCFQRRGLAVVSLLPSEVGFSCYGGVRVLAAFYRVRAFGEGFQEGLGHV